MISDVENLAADDDHGIPTTGRSAASRCWHDELRAAGHEVIARNRANRGVDDPVLSRLDELGFDQLWLMAVDVGDGLTDAEADAIVRFRENGEGCSPRAITRTLGRCLLRLGSVGMVNQFHDETWTPPRCATTRTPRPSHGPTTIPAPTATTSRCSPRAGASAAAHHRTASGRIEWFPAHPHEGGVSARAPFATVIAQGRSTATGRHFNLAVVLDGELTPDGRPMGRALAESTFHHFADYNWDLDRGAPSFVTEPPGTQIKADPSRLAVYKDYVRNVATWLQPTTTRYPSPVVGRRVVQPI